MQTVRGPGRPGALRARPKTQGRPALSPAWLRSRRQVRCLGPRPARCLPPSRGRSGAGSVSRAPRQQVSGSEATGAFTGGGRSRGRHAGLARACAGDTARAAQSGRPGGCVRAPRQGAPARTSEVVVRLAPEACAVFLAPPIYNGGGTPCVLGHGAAERPHGPCPCPSLSGHRALSPRKVWSAPTVGHPCHGPAALMRRPAAAPWCHGRPRPASPSRHPPPAPCSPGD